MDDFPPILMTLIVSQNGKDAKRIARTSFGNEAELQQYIHENPDVIPLNDIDEDIRLLILAREFPTESGPIDAVAVDATGQLYLIETKLYKNPDKRHVVAQVLDYGASLWRHYNDFDSFRAVLDGRVQEKWQMSLEEKLADFFDLPPEEIPDLLGSMRSNLDEGLFKFVVLMDQLHDRLKDLLRFINRYSRFDFYAVEVEYYKHDSYEIMIPRLFGAEVKKDAAVSRPRESRTYSLEEHFQGSYATMQPAYNALFESIQKMYPDVEIHPKKEHIGFSINGKRVLYAMVQVSKIIVWMPGTMKDDFDDPKNLVLQNSPEKYPSVLMHDEKDVSEAVSIISQALKKTTT